MQLPKIMRETNNFIVGLMMVVIQLRSYWDSNCVLPQIVVRDSKCENCFKTIITQEKANVVKGIVF